MTQCDLHYEGSISIDAALLERSGILPHEQVDVLNITTGARFTAHTLAAPVSSGMIGINGAAARLAQQGDLVIIVAYARMDEARGQELATAGNAGGCQQPPAGTEFACLMET